MRLQDPCRISQQYLAPTPSPNSRPSLTHPKQHPHASIPDLPLLSNPQIPLHHIPPHRPSKFDSWWCAETGLHEQGFSSCNVSPLSSLTAARQGLSRLPSHPLFFSLSRQPHTHTAHQTCIHIQWGEAADSCEGEFPMIPKKKEKR